MPDQIHDVEFDTSEAMVRSLLRELCAAWSDLPMTKSSSHTGTSNALWRLHRSDGADLIVRLPRTEGAVSGIATEVALLPLLARSEWAKLVSIPTVRHAGQPTDQFPQPWAVLEWVDGDDAWSIRNELDDTSPDLASELARVVRSIGSLGRNR